ncbi:Hsp20 family protein [Marinivivus vitaminiproducens]|uniref:Hsp20 family protein n=1 Tax=Marinivivus vitaminiproducens TaxID=3035935 RepID=UPI00279CF4B0|nr:Hsp20 family protein [Geminicoccaceae bacterium SCSIO 64248]
MRTAFDVSPLFRSSIGFDHVLSALEAARRVEPIDAWPAYDILKSSEDAYRITMAVAGFTEDDLTLIQERNTLVVSGRKPAAAEDSGHYLHRGIAGHAFQRRFELADHVKVAGAALKHGLLTIELKRELPDAMKPHRIAITTDRARPTVEAKPSAAEKLAA